MRRLASSAVLLVLLSLVGCRSTAKVNYGRSPLPPRIPTPVSRCVMEEGITTVSANASVQWKSGAWLNRKSMTGIAFMQGNKRLSPAKVLHMIDDRPLEQAYRSRLSSLGSGMGFAAFRMKFGMGMAIAGLTTALVVAPFTGGDGYFVVAPIGAGVGLLGTLLWATGYTKRHKMQTHDAYKKFLFENDMAARAAAGVKRYNVRVVERCIDRTRR